MSSIINAHTLRQHIVAGNPVCFIDVRHANETLMCRIGGINIPAGNLGARLGTLDPYKTALVVIGCNSTGTRAQNAQSFLQDRGFENVRILSGGVRSYKSANYPDIINRMP